jgi:ABC-type branched-subunit amino acid transport system substrate-binding protein
MKKRKVFFVLLFLTVFACASALGQEFRVGTLLPYSGALKESGPNVRNGVTLAAKQMALAGFDVNLIHADSRTSAPAAVAAAEKLVRENNVVAIIGAEASGVTSAVAEMVALPNDVLMVSHASTSPILTDLASDRVKDLLFRTCPSDALQGVVLGKLAASLYHSAAVMYVNNPYGQGLAEMFKKSFEKRGGKVLSMVPHQEEVASSYLPELKTALASAYVPAQTIETGDSKKYLKRAYLPQKPEVLCAFSYPEHAIVYLKEAVNQMNYRSFLFCDGTKSIDILNAVGAKNLEGLMGTAPGSASGEPYFDFIADYKAEFKILPPLPYITNAYDAMAVIGLAAYAVNLKGLPLTGPNLRDYMRQVANPPGNFIKPGEFEAAFALLRQGKDINYEGASGALDFDENGDVEAPIEVWQFAANKIVTFRMEYQVPKE